MVQIKRPCPPELDGDDFCVGSRPHKIADLAPGRHRGKIGAVPRGVKRRDNRVGVIAGERGVYLLLRVFHAYIIAGRGRPYCREVVDIADFTGTVLVFEAVQRVVYPGVYKADKDALPPELQKGLLLNLDYARSLKTRPVEQAEHY